MTTFKIELKCVEIKQDHLVWSKKFFFLLNYKELIDKLIFLQLLSAAYKKINTLVLDLYRNIGQVASGTFTRQPSLRSQLSQVSTNESHAASPPNSSFFHYDRSNDSTLIGSTGGTPVSSSFNHFFHFTNDHSFEYEHKQAQASAFDTPPVKRVIDEDCKKNKGDSPVDQRQLLRNVNDKCVDMDQRILEETIRIDNTIRKIEFLESNLRQLSYDFNGKFCNGVLVWKIPNFVYISHEMEKKKRIFHSPPFYTSQFGYKFCLRTNVTISSDESFLTLYLHLMESENDDFLDFPFQGRISLSLLDCRDSSNKQHFTENMEAVGSLDAFKRPMVFRSVKGYGYKEFVSLNQIFSPPNGCEFLKNNAIYIKVVVTTINMR